VYSNLPKKQTEQTLAALGQNIRHRRKAKQWTQEDFAEAAGINDKEVSHIEAGNRNITIETLIKISLALDVEPTTLLCTGKS